MKYPNHEYPIPSDSSMALKVLVSRERLRRALENSNEEWLVLDGDEVVVRVELTPPAWRGLASSLTVNSGEPEWRLQNCMGPEGTGLTVWEECRAGMEGPGVWLSRDSCMLSLRVAPLPK
jgi:hypothetical protein